MRLNFTLVYTFASTMAPSQVGRDGLSGGQDFHCVYDTLVRSMMETQLDRSSITFLYPDPSDGCPASSCLQSSEELEQEAAA